MNPEVMAISAITVDARHRRDMGDLAQFASSIEEIGLLHPIVVNRCGVLIAGERRLRACSEVLGWAEVPVTVIDLKQILLGEFAENAERKDFLPSEIEAIRRAMAPAEKAAAKERQVSGLRQGNVPSGKVSHTDKPAERARDRLGSFAGVSGRTIEKIATIVKAAEKDPERFGHLVEEMDRTRRADGAFRKLRAAEDEARVKSLKIVPGRYRTLVIDPPWRSNGGGGSRGRPEYATLTQEELLVLPVESWAEDDCHLYLWTMNSMVPHAVELMARWGFDHKSALTWVKPRWGLGEYFRSQSEHCLFGVRGRLQTRSNSISTIFDAPIGEHSEKPERFYEIVRAASFEPFGEVFQRTARPDFRSVYVEAEGAP